MTWVIWTVKDDINFYENRQRTEILLIKDNFKLWKWQPISTFIKVLDDPNIN